MRLWLVISTLILIGCAGKHPPAVPLALPVQEGLSVTALPVPDDSTPLILPMIEPSGNHLQVIDRANTAAMIFPTADDFVRSMAVLPWRAGALYVVDMAEAQGTDFVFSPGEQVQIFTPGDARFEHKISEGIDPVHLIVRPTRAQMKTRFTIVTTEATYYVLARSHATRGLAAVSWKHPVKRAPMENTVGSYGIGYGLPSDAPDVGWKPLYIWDTGKQTMILFHPRMRSTQAPIVSVRPPEGPNLVVNYRLKATHLYSVDRLLDVGESFDLQVNADDDRVVRVQKTSEYQTVTCPGHEVCSLIQRSMRTTTYAQR
jgi:type IV secretory pathway VirB9-like protein